jgi:hypothetical protein
MAARCRSDLNGRTRIRSCRGIVCALQAENHHPRCFIWRSYGSLWSANVTLDTPRESRAERHVESVKSPQPRAIMDEAAYAVGSQGEYSCSKLRLKSAAMQSSGWHWDDSLRCLRRG